MQNRVKINFLSSVTPMKFEDIRPFLLYNFKSDHELIKAIEELSLKFTQEREHITDYLSDPRLVSAYAAFYLTTNIPKLEAVFKWLPAAWLEELKKTDFVDLGAGPGTFSLAYKNWGGSGSITQIEISSLMQEQARALMKGLYPTAELHQMKSWKGEKGKPKFVLFGHSANEMGADVALRYLREIDPDHILFIEPGTKTFFPEMLKIRDALIQDGFHNLYPCPTQEACPMRQSANDWCHQFIHVSHSQDVERLSQMMKKDRKLLPLTVHAFSKTYGPADQTQRLVRVLPSTKFSFEWEVCTGGDIEHYQIMKRPYDKKAIKELEEVLAGASLEVELEKDLEKSKRVKLLNIK